MSRSRNVANRTQTGSPHIITTKLHPAYLGKLLDGTTSHSGAYGTEQSDGRMYYYTSIAGSKPIHDPRIGAYFGSQRHLISTMQLLPEETHAHGHEINCLDGREWMRVSNHAGGFKIRNTDQGIFLQINTSADTGKDFIEIVGYFNGVNVGAYTNTSRKNFTASVDGATSGGGFASVTATSTFSAKPFDQRFIESSSVINIPLTVDLGIHTIKITFVGSNSGSNIYLTELIAQDTTDTASRSKIQIPKQSVYTGNGKHEVPAQAVHYDPFNGMSTASGFGGYVDEKSSLGLEKWKVGATCYRPYNGARVVKWVDLDGVVKTSVTCMPPNAKNILNTAINAKTASSGNDTFLPTFETHSTSINEDQLSELAKNFMFCEYGNGAANARDGAPWADASMIRAGIDDIAYTMGDGLSTIIGESVQEKETFSSGTSLGIGMGSADGTDYIHIIFIGTGIGFDTLPYGEARGRATIVENLPYGTHVLRVLREGANSGLDPDYTIDGVALNDVDLNTYGAFTEVYINQPKMPNIPDDACILADYMLMADFKPQTSSGQTYISKGVRFCSNSRDIYYNPANNSSYNAVLNTAFFGGFEYWNNAANFDIHLTAFGSNFVAQIREPSVRSDIQLDGSTQSDAVIGSGSDICSYAHLLNDTTLGIHKFGHTNKSGQNGAFSGYSIVTPIHTSHHYKGFETQCLLNEMVGGDRNLEQNYLVCSPEGKTWDDITRNKSYFGNRYVTRWPKNDASSSGNSAWTLQKTRGRYEEQDISWKYFYFHDYRIICLEDGLYRFHAFSYGSSTWGHFYMYIRRKYDTSLTELASYNHVPGGSTNITQSNQVIVSLQRGDTVWATGGHEGPSAWEEYHIERIGER